MPSLLVARAALHLPLFLGCLGGLSLEVTCVRVSAQAAADASFAPPFEALAEAIAAADYLPWLREGTRVSYRTTTSSARGAANATTSLTQLDVVSVAGGVVGANTNSWSEVQGAAFGIRSGWMLVGQSAHVAPAGYGEYWVHPTVLTQAAEHHGEGKRGWLVTRDTQERAGKTYEAVTLTASDDKRRQQYVYDIESGVLLGLDFAERTRAKAEFRPTLSLELVGIRQRKLPWQEGRPPAWALSTKHLLFEGSAVTAYPDGRTEEKKASSRMDVADRGPNSILVTTDTKLDGKSLGEAVQVMSGSSSSGGFWMPPLELRTLADRFQRKKIRLDRDPLTRAELSLTFVGRSPYGRQIVTLTEETPVANTSYDYELTTGALLASVTHYAASSTTIRMQLTEVE